MSDGQLDRIEKTVTRLDKFITGGDEPGEGIIVRLDRVEQREKQRTWFARTALGAAIAALITSISKLT